MNKIWIDLRKHELEQKMFVFYQQHQMEIFEQVLGISKFERVMIGILNGFNKTGIKYL